MGQHWRAYRDSVAHLDRLRAERDALAAEDEWSAFQLEEIRRLAPRPGEEAELERELQVLDQRRDSIPSSLQLYDSLYQREGAVYEGTRPSSPVSSTGCAKSTLRSARKPRP